MRNWLASLLLLFFTTTAIGAEEIGLVPLSPFSYGGVVQQVTPGGLWLQTSNGVNLMLPQGLNFEVGGVQVGLGGLGVGQPVNVFVPATSGQLVAVDDHFATFMLPQGPMMVPLNVLPDSAQKAKVAVLKPNGKIVNVPLNAALNMQRSQGARILGYSGLQHPAWNGQAGDGVVCGIQGDNWLICSSEGRIWSVPRSQAPDLVPGHALHVPGGGKFKHESWKPGKGHGNSGKYDGGPGNSGKGNSDHGNSGKSKGNPGKGKSKGK